MGWVKRAVRSVTKPVSKAVKTVTKPVEKLASSKAGAALGVVAAPVTGGASLALTGAYAAKQLKAATKTPSGAEVDTHTAESVINESEKKAKQTRARLLATAGGILGEEVDEVQKKGGRNIFGN